DRPNLYFAVEAPDGSEVYPYLPDGTEGCWRHSKDRLEREIQNGEFEFIKNTEGEWILYQKIYASKEGKVAKRFTNMIDDISSGKGTKYLQKLFNAKIFDYPKPVELVRKLIKMGSVKNECVILDF